MYLYLLICLLISNCYKVILNETRETIKEFCVNHQTRDDLIIVVEDYDDENIKIEWELIYIQIDNSITVNGCLTSQYQKRVYLDWNYRLGAQLIRSNRSEFGVVVSDPASFYSLIDLPSRNANNATVQLGNTFFLNHTTLLNSSDYYIIMTGVIGNISIQFQQILQIRVMQQPADLFPRLSVSIQKLVPPDQSEIELITSQMYDWRIFIREPTRFGSRLSTLSQQHTNFVNISLTPTWTDKLYVVTIILIDSNGTQYYSADWFHQVGQQWTNQQNLDCNISSLLQLSESNWTERYSCLEWASGELPVMLPQYDYISIEWALNCSNGSILQTSYQPLPYCLCKDNITGINCDTIVDDKAFNISTAYNAILLNDLQNQTLDNSTFQRVLYLMAKETQGIDQNLFDSLNNRSYQFSQQLLLIFDTLAIKGILNKNINLTVDIFEAISNTKNTFELTGIFTLNTFLIYTSTIYQLTKLNNNTAFQLSYKSNQSINQDSACIFLNPNFTYTQMIVYSQSFSHMVRPDIFSQYMTCSAFSINANLILNINTNMTIITNKLLTEISRPTQMRCKSNSTVNQCKIHRLYDNYAQVSYYSFNGPYVIERSPVLKSFDYQTIVESINNPSGQLLLLNYIVQILFVIF